MYTLCITAIPSIHPIVCDTIGCIEWDFMDLGEIMVCGSFWLVGGSDVAICCGHE